MTEVVNEVEAIRARFRPSRITTLFVGESAPVSGDFFYYGNTNMTRYMKQTVDAAFGESSTDFLERFRSFGWYLDDLVLEPVNAMKGPERRASCRSAQQSLTDRIGRYQPLAIVSLMKSINPIVDAA